jgi:hypothetical protein
MMAPLQPKHLIFLICLFLTRGILAQGNSELAPPEKSLLELIINDTISHTVSYLPEAYEFSVADKGDKHFILLKSGKYNFFLLDGTNRVYIPDPSQPTASLIRIDSTSFTGDNFNMMAFIRKDTLYQYGGYGFWNNRDFFSFYRPTIHGWEFVTGGDGLDNLFTLNYFDIRADRFYTIGRYHQNTHQSMTPAYYDSVYRYDLQTGKWDVLGLINRDDYKKVTPQRGYFWTSPFGLGTYYLHNCQYIDFPDNRVYSLRKIALDSLEFIVENKTFADKKFQHLIYLHDTLFIINGDDKTSGIGKIRLVKSDFELAKGKPLYEPNSVLKKGIINISITLLQSIIVALAVLIISAYLLIHFLRKKRNALITDANSSANELNEENALYHETPGIVVVEPGKKHDISAFLQNLSEVEKELVKEIVTHSLQGKKMDTHEINKILGVSLKDAEIQKARRSMTISRINNEYTRTVKSNGLLIQRERDPLDKRAYLYCMPDHLAKKVSESMG